MADQLDHPITTDIKTRVAALLKEGHDLQQAFIAGLSDEQRTQVGKPDNWSPKDTIAHITFWQQRQLKRHEAVARGEDFPDLNWVEVNDETFLKVRDLTWNEVIAEADRVYTALLALLESHSEADLITAGKPPATGNNELWQNFVSNGYSHPIDHYADFYVQQGDMARGIALQERAVRINSEMGGEQARMVAVYNLACFYTRIGQNDRAIELLREAFALAYKRSADLIDWSKQDPDLNPLREIPEFQALYHVPA